MTQHFLLQQLDAADNEEKVREDIALGYYNPNDAALAQEWLRRREEVRSDAAFARSESRSEESLSISRKALDNSRLATRIAISAIVLSIIMATYEIIKWYSAK